MAGYYDPNKDYSKAINEAKAAGKDTTQLEQERQNKIDSKYGGKEPNMYGSNKTYSQLSGSGSTWKDRDEISSAINIANTAQNNSIKQQMEKEAQAGNWDKVGSLANGLAVPDGMHGGQDLTYVNQAWHDVAQKYGYNAKEYYDSQYDKEYGAGPAAAFDATQYLKDMYAQNLQAELAALKSTYEQNLEDLNANDDMISAAYDKQRNQAAAQNDLQRMYMNELGIMQGLNTGTTGQMALAQSAAYRGDLAQIGAQEAQSLSDNNLNRQKLTIAYRNAADQAAAEGNAQMASALYDEYVRQQNLLLQQQAAALEQQNWLDKFNYQKEQDALAQRNWQAQFDYQKAQDDLNYQRSLQKLYAKNASDRGTKKIMSSPNESTQRVVVPNADTGIQVKPLDYSTIVKNSEAGNYGPKYGLVLGNVQAQLTRGADLATISDIIKRAVDSGDINNEGADTILQALGY